MARSTRNVGPSLEGAHLPVGTPDQPPQLRADSNAVVGRKVECVPRDRQGQLGHYSEQKGGCVVTKETESGDRVKVPELFRRWDGRFGEEQGFPAMRLTMAGSSTTTILTVLTTRYAILFRFR